MHSNNGFCNRSNDYPAIDSGLLDISKDYKSKLFIRWSFLWTESIGLWVAWFYTWNTYFIQLLSATTIESVFRLSGRMNFEESLHDRLYKNYKENFGEPRFLSLFYLIGFNKYSHSKYQYSSVQTLHVNTRTQRTFDFCLYTLLVIRVHHKRTFY